MTLRIFTLYINVYTVRHYDYRKWDMLVIVCQYDASCIFMRHVYFYVPEN